jgi:hypothetical protein
MVTVSHTRTLVPRFTCVTGTADVHFRKAYRGNRGIPALILNLYTRC